MCSKMMYESETWGVRVENMCFMWRNDIRMIRWMYNVSLKDQLRSDELRGRLNLDSIGRCVQNRRLHWFGQIERMDESAWVSRCTAFVVAGSVGRGRQKKTWIIRMHWRERRVKTWPEMGWLGSQFLEPV